jgi:hypothetical protein
VAARSQLARQLDAVAMVLTAGRDLLHTHLANDARGARQFRSEWGLVVCSPPAERALLAQLAWLAHQVAAPLHGRCPGRPISRHRRRATRPARRLRMAAGIQRLRAGRQSGRPGLSYRS